MKVLCSSPELVALLKQGYTVEIDLLIEDYDTLEAIAESMDDTMEILDEGGVVTKADILAELKSRNAI